MNLSLTSQEIIKDKQIIHDNHHDESKTRTHILSKLSDDGDPLAPNNLRKSRAKKKKKKKKKKTKQKKKQKKKKKKKTKQETPVGLATGKKPWPQLTKMNSFMSEPSSESGAQTTGVQLKKAA